jgi:Putative zinc-finger
VTACNGTREAIGAYVLGALDPDEAAAVRAHLAACPRCADEHAALAGLPELLSLAGGAHAATSEPLGPGFEERLLDSVARARAPRSRPSRRRRLLRRPRALVAGGLAAVLLAAGGAFAFFTRDDGGGGYNLALKPTNAAPGATARAQLESRSSGMRIKLWVRDLPTAPGDVYEVQCLAKGWTAPAGTFRVDAEGKGYAILTSAMRRGEYTGIRVFRRHHASKGKPPEVTAVLAARVN